MIVLSTRQLLARAREACGGWRSSSAWDRVRWFLDVYLSTAVALSFMACAAAAGATYIYVAYLEPAAARLDQAEQAAATVRNVTRTRVRQDLMENTPAKRLEEFYADFPPEQDLPDILENIFNQAQAAGLPAGTANYIYSEEKIGKLVQYNMILPLKGTYPRLRQFIGAVQRTAPTVAVNEVRLQRLKVSSDIVDAKIKLILYLRRGA